MWIQTFSISNGLFITTYLDAILLLIIEYLSAIIVVNHMIPNTTYIEKKTYENYDNSNINSKRRSTRFISEFPENMSIVWTW